MKSGHGPPSIVIYLTDHASSPSSSHNGSPITQLTVSRPDPLPLLEDSIPVPVGRFRHAMAEASSLIIPVDQEEHIGYPHPLGTAIPSQIEYTFLE